MMWCTHPSGAAVKSAWGGTFVEGGYRTSLPGRLSAQPPASACAAHWRSAQPWHGFGQFERVVTGHVRWRRTPPAHRQAPGGCRASGARPLTCRPVCPHLLVGGQQVAFDTRSAGPSAKPALARFIVAGSGTRCPICRLQALASNPSCGRPGGVTASMRDAFHAQVGRGP